MGNLIPKDPMPSLSEIGKHLGVTRQMVAKLKKRGMPINSLKAAARWRGEQQLKRVASNAKTAEMRTTGKGRPPKPKKPSNTGDSLLDALNNTITVADDAFMAYQRAVAGNLSTQSARLSEHNKAVEARLKAEKLYREELERRNILVPKAVILESCRRCLDAVLRRLKKLPMEQGPQCNPQEPLMATTILEREINEIIAVGQKALKGL